MFANSSLIRLHYIFPSPERRGLFSIPDGDSKAAEYIKTDNLEKTVEKMQTDLGKIRETKQLAEVQELGTKLSKLSEVLGVSSESLQKSGIRLTSTVFKHLILVTDLAMVYLHEFGNLSTLQTSEKKH